MRKPNDPIIRMMLIEDRKSAMKTIKDYVETQDCANCPGKDECDIRAAFDGKFDEYLNSIN